LTVSNDTYWEMFKMYDGVNNNAYCQTTFYNATQKWTFTLHVADDAATDHTVGTVANLLPNTWYWVQIYYKSGDGNGIIRAKIGGSTIEKTNLDNDATRNEVDLFYAGVWNSQNRITGGSIDFDDISVHNSAMESGPPNLSYLWQTAVTTEPYQVFENGTRAVLGSSAAELTSGQWFWAGNVLYIYSLTDPDTAFTSPGVESSVLNNAVLISDKDYITIEDLEARYSNTTGLFIDASNHIIIRRVSTNYNVSSGIGIYHAVTASDDGLIEDCASAYNFRSGIFIGQNSTNWTARGNTLHHNGMIKTAVSTFAGGIYVFGGTFGASSVSNIILEDNLSYNNGYSYTDGAPCTTNNFMGYDYWFDTVGTGCIARRNKAHDSANAGFHLERSAGVKIHNNVVYRTPYGIVMVPTGGDPLTANEVYNNTFYGETGDSGYIYFGIFLNAAGNVENQFINNVIKNNIVAGNFTKKLSARYGAQNDGTYGSGNVYESNCFGAQATNFIEWGLNTNKSTYADWETAYGGSTHSVQSDPLLTATYRFGAGSPAIDAGTPIFTAAEWLANGDAAGNHYVYGSGVDIGAYERKKFLFDDDDIIPRKCKSTNAACYVQE
jgi:hypothetical protein